MSMHFCESNLAAVMFSAGGGNATCGMMSKVIPDNGSPVLSADCCHNSHLVYSVDDYSGSTQLHLQELTFLQSFVFILPLSVKALEAEKFSIYRHLIFPEKDLLAGGVPIEGLCNFRI